jgi:predicted DNA-binding protein
LSGSLLESPAPFAQCCPCHAQDQRLSRDERADRLALLARAEGRPQAEIVRDAISSYRPRPERDRNFALAGNFERIDPDSRPISEIPEDELMRGFGE